MATAAGNRVLSEALLGGAGSGTAQLLRRIALVGLGVAAMAIAAKVKLPMWPVPITMQSFVILSVGAAYGPRLGAATVLAYLAIGAVGFDVFTNSSASENGLAYMMGGTGGYLLGFLLATLALGAAARAGWDRSVLRLLGAMLLGNALIFAPGILWLGLLHGWDQPILAWGLWPFLPGMVLKTLLAALLFPAIWRAVGPARG